MACNVATRNLFAESEQVKRLQQEIARLQEQMQAKEQVLAIAAHVLCSNYLCIHVHEIGENYI